MALNLDPAIRFVESIMNATVKITRPVADASRPTLDPTTLKYIVPPATEEPSGTEIYNGKALVSVVDQFQARFEQGGQSIGETEYFLRLPLGTGPVETYLYRDEVSVLSCDEMPYLVGEIFVVKSEIVGSHPASRKLVMVHQKSVEQ